MPRAGKKSANQHNNRHENGVVAPGKRITKQKSNGQLNGSPEGKSRANTPPVPTPTSLSHPTPNGHANGIAISGTRSTGARLDQTRSTNADLSDETSTLDCGTGYMDKMGEQNNRRTDGTTAKASLAQENGVLPSALTVLKNSPMRDTLAILIVLLSFPPTVHTITNIAFAIITFVPPSGSFTQIPTISELMSSFSPGTPSFVVTCLFDCIAMALWIWLPSSIQALALDTAQAMVATTLGGGYNYKPGATDNTVLCVLLVSLTHLARYRPKLYQILHRTFLGRWTPIPGEIDPHYVASRYPVGSERSWFSTIKVMIALHIVVQGITRMVRRILYSSRYSAAPPPMSTTRPPDQEASVGYHAGSDLQDHAQNPPHSPMELKSRSSLQNMREVRDKVSSGKRRRKQANYVKSQQPFWTAFAAAKATVMREIEVTRANADAISSHATDIGNYGNAPFATSENRVWITSIRETSFSFEISHLTAGKKAEFSSDEEDSGVVRSKPLYVRCNGMDWSSVRLEEVPGTQDEWKRSQWAGEVSVLSPGKTYQVAFLGSEDHVAIHSETIATLPSTVNEPTSSHPTTVALQPVRPASPASPIATLKNSIASFESSLADVSSRQRRDRKDNKSTLSALRREIESLANKLSEKAEKDKSAQTRQIQQAQLARQTDESIVALTKELDNYAEIPEEDTEEWIKRKAALEAARNEHISARENLMRTKETNYRLYTSHQSAELTARHKRERLQARLDRISKQHMRLTSPAEPAEKARSNSEHSIKLSDRYQKEDNYRKEIDSLTQSFQYIASQHNLYQQQIQALEYSIHQAAAESAARLSYPQQVDSRPITPEGDLPGTNPVVPLHVYPTSGRYSAYGTPDSHAVPMANGKSFHGNGSAYSDSNRVRSTSGMSREGIFLDFDDDDDMIPAKAKRRSGIEAVREGSEGSGSGSGSPSVRYRNWNSPSPRVV